MDAGRVDFGVGELDVGFGAVRDGDDGVGCEDGGALHPGAQGVAGAQLLGLPGAQGLERMGGEDEGDAVELFGKEAGHGHVPGVGVDEVDLAELFHGAEVEGEGVYGGFEFFFGVSRDLGWGFVAADVEVAFVFALGAPAVDFDFDFAGELAGEVFDVDAGPAVDVGWVLAGHEAYAHGVTGLRKDCSRCLGPHLSARCGCPICAWREGRQEQQQIPAG